MNTFVNSIIKKNCHKDPLPYCRMSPTSNLFSYFFLFFYYYYLMENFISLNVCDLGRLHSPSGYRGPVIQCYRCSHTGQTPNNPSHRWHCLQTFWGIQRGPHSWTANRKGVHHTGGHTNEDPILYEQKKKVGGSHDHEFKWVNQGI